MRDYPTALLAVCIFFAAATASAQDTNAPPVVAGAGASRSGLGNAMVVKRLSPQELQAEVERYDAARCRNGKLRARTDGTRFWIGDSVFSFDGFADELVRRYKARRFHCVAIRGPGYDPGRISRLLGRVREATGIDSIDWTPRTSN